MSYKTNIDDTTKRNQLRSLMDDFTSFSWRGDDAFETFGAFIVGGKDALKFYNGPGFSNKYTKPQFETASSILTGVDFKTQTLSFTIGIYWFSIEEYRKFLYWLHPYEINELVFHHAPNWRYMVKLSKLDDSTRHIIGRGADGTYRYYTELKVSFELQGEPCLRYTVPYQIDWVYNEAHIAGTQVVGTFFSNDSDFYPSDLNTPIDFTARFIPTTKLQEGDLYPDNFLKPSNNTFPGSVLANLGTNYSIKLEAVLPFSTATANTMTLFNITLQHLGEEAVIVYVTNEDGTITSKEAWYNGNISAINLRYISESGILLFQLGESEEKILTLQTSAMSGQRLCQTLQVNKFFLPGKLEYPGIENFFEQITFRLTTSETIQPVIYYNQENDSHLFDISLEAYARTNVI